MSAAPKTPADAEVYVTREFVFCGVRYNADKKKRFVEIAPIGDDGKLMPACWYAWDRGLERNVGHVYRADFSDNRVKNMKGAPWVRVWPVVEDNLRWEAAHQQAETTFRRAKMEEAKGKSTQIDKVMEPLREIMTGYMRRGDRMGALALEALVIDALRRPISLGKK